MARAKIIEFSQDEQVGAKVGFSLGHPARIRILKLLQENPVVSFGQIQRQVPLSNATICQHLRVLDRSDLIESAYLEDGAVGYRLREVVRREAFEFLVDLLAA
ncbi:MAG: winged helix-turn-helix domain-containing protein [Bacteroidota bacterium]